MSGEPSGTVARVVARAGRAVDTVLDRTVAPGFSTIGYAVRRRLPGWPADPPPGALTGRHVAVTGASSGLGRQTAVELAALGAHVHLVVRDEDRGRRVADELGEPSTVWRCDVSDLDSVRDFGQAYLAGGAHLDALVHNAGSMPQERRESAQCREMTMALHVLGPVAMTEQLLPAMTGRQARVVFVTSGGMYSQRLRADDPDYLEPPYSPTTAYARSKRAQVELLPVLQRRWQPHGVRVYAMHPGWANTPGITSSLPTFSRLTRPVLRDARAGVDTTTWLVATDPAPPGGGLWHDRRQRPTHLLPRTRVGESEQARLRAWVGYQVGMSLGG